MNKIAKLLSRRCIFFVALLACCFAPLGRAATTAPSTQPAPRDLLTDCDDSTFYSARISAEHEGDSAYEVTQLAYRKFQGNWTDMPQVPARVISLAGNGGELLVVLDDGQWMISDTSDLRLGASPPDNGLVRAMASESEVLYAIVDAPEMPATTRSSTAATLPEGQTALVAPVPRHLMMYHIEAGNWIQPTALPAGVSGDASTMSFQLVGRLPALAWVSGDQEIRVSQFGADGKWTVPHVISSPHPIGNFKLLNIEDHPALWIAGTAGSGGNLSNAGLLLTGDGFSSSHTLQISGMTAPASAAQTIEVAFNHIHWIAADQDKPLIEQNYNVDNDQPDGAAMALAAAPQLPLPIGPVVGSALMVLLVASLAGAVQRKNVEEETVDANPRDAKLQLAPLGLRVAAGLIDLLPVLLALAYLPEQTPGNEKIFGASVRIIFALAVVTYIGHCMLAELFCGQSIGKMVLGLRVVTVDGKKPSPRALVIRNVLRLLDVCAILPLFFTIFTPMNQRLGDNPAQTVVVGRTAPDVDNEM